VIQTEDGRLAYLIQIHPEDEELYNRTEGQHPWGEEGEWVDLPDHAELVFDPTTLDDDFFTFVCHDCEERFVDRKVFGPSGPCCPKCEPES